MIYISYRRNDTDAEAQRLKEETTRFFGVECAFMDVAATLSGQNPRQAIDEYVGNSEALLAVMGKGWLAAADASGERCLDDVGDLVRYEIASALKGEITVVPVLMQGAKAPRGDELPEDLKQLAYRSGLTLTDEHWESDVQVLLTSLAAIPNVAPIEQGNSNSETAQSGSPEDTRGTDPAVPVKQGSRARVVAFAAVVISGLAIGFLWLGRQPKSEQPAPVWVPPQNSSVPPPAAVDPSGNSSAPSVAVPMLINLSVAEAEQRLRDLGIPYRVAVVNDPRGKAGIVVNQVPRPPARVTNQSRIELTVSEVKK